MIRSERSNQVPSQNGNTNANEDDFLDVPLEELPIHANQEYITARRNKIEAIGTLLEKVVINDPYKALNCQ